MSTKSTTMRPEELASKLGISGKVLRAELRKRYTRPATAKGTSWVLDAKQVTEITKVFKDRQPKAKS